MPAAGAGAAPEEGAGDAAAVVVEGAGAALSVLQAGNIAKTEQTKSFFGAIMTSSSLPNSRRGVFDSSGNGLYNVVRAGF